MRYLKLFESFDDISSVKTKEICKKYNITNYTINEDGTIDVDDSVNLSYKGLTELPLRFRNVSGSFWCDSNKLISLEGSPKSVGGSFLCYNNKLTSLEGSPQSVGVHFDCYHNLLKNLKGCPQTVGSNFICRDNKLFSLDGIDRISVGGDFYFHNNPCYKIYKEWINTDRREELLDLMDDYDFLRGDTINWYLLEAFFEDAGLEIPDSSLFSKNNILKKELQKYYTIED
jgi:hypothetical protein